MIDTDHAHAQLRQIKQGRNERVAIYAERLYSIGREAYEGVNTQSADAKALIEQQLINYFLDGLNSDGVK